MIIAQFINTYMHNTHISGQEAGNGLADVLFGLINPSGRLLYTLPHSENEQAMSTAQYPGSGQPPEALYSEQLAVGYR